jgi:GR25 family glycosyltransferase involved in LPS biosynthesis
MIEWHLNRSFQGLVEKKNTNKFLGLSAIISGENRLEGHQLRLSLIKLLDDTSIKFDLFGKHRHNLKNYRGPLQFKDEGLRDYKYHIAIENCAEKGYFTEKLVDGILSDCLCFYWGAPDIDQYIDPRAIIQLPLHNLELSVEVIRLALEKDIYQERLPFIQNEKKRILYGWSLFPTIDRLLSGINPPSIPTFVINLDNRPERYFKFTEVMYGIPYKRFSAINGREMKLSGNGELDRIVQDRGYPKKNPYKYHSKEPGVIGCMLSHMTLWENLVTDKEAAEYAIFEDDIIPHPEFLKMWCTLHARLKKIDYDLCFMGYLDDLPIYNDEVAFQDTYKGTDEKETVLTLRSFSHQARRNGGGTHGYVVSKKGAEKLLSFAHKYGVPQPIDWFMIEMFPFLKAFKCDPHLIEQTNEFVSDVQ